MSQLSNIDNCFKEGLLRRVEPSAIKSNESIMQAKEWLSEAEKNINIEAYRSALASIYLVFFHAARSVLFRDGVREKSHYCIGVYLEKYVQKDILEEEWALIFDRIRSARHTNQYSFHVHPTIEEVESAIKASEKFIGRMERLIKETVLE